MANCLFVRRRLNLLKLPTLAELFAGLSVVAIVGRNNSSAASFSISATNSALSRGQTYYIFSICAQGNTTPYPAYFGIYKVSILANASEWDATSKTDILVTNNAVANIYLDGASCYYSADGTQSTPVYGGSLVVTQFLNYSEEEVDAVLSKITLGATYGRNSSSAYQAYLPATSLGKFVLASHNLNFAIDSYENNTITNIVARTQSTVSNPSLLWLDGGSYYYSTNGTSGNSVRGACVISFS